MAVQFGPKTALRDVLAKREVMRVYSYQSLCNLTNLLDLRFKASLIYSLILDLFRCSTRVAPLAMCPRGRF
jgi:hypothetical protein